MPGVRPIARNAQTSYDSWKLFFPFNIIDEIVCCTNKQLMVISPSYARGNKDCPQTSSFFFGVFYMAGVKKSWIRRWFGVRRWHSSRFLCVNNVKKTIPDPYLSIRFGDKNTRIALWPEDSLAPIRHVFEEFVKQCQETYNFGKFTTLDEMLEVFRRQCKFRQYIANKPANYIIIIYALIDARNFLQRILLNSHRDSMTLEH